MFPHLQELLGQELSLGAALDRRLSCLKHLRLQPGVQTGLNPKHASRVLRGLAKQSQVGFGTFFLLLFLFLSAARCYPRTSALPNPGLSAEQRGIQRGFSPAREPDPPPVAAPEPAERGITSPRAGTAGAGLLCPADTGGPWKGGARTLPALQITPKIQILAVNFGCRDVGEDGAGSILSILPLNRDGTTDESPLVCWAAH